MISGKGLFYEKLPRDVTGTHWTGTKKEDGSRNLFVDAFLLRVLPEGRRSESDMRYKHLALDPKCRKINKPKKKKRGKSLTAKKKKALNLFKLNADEVKYELYLPLHELWKDYMKDLLYLHKVTAKNQGEAERKFMKADLHGSIILVAKSKCPSLLGLTGIVLQETKNTFRLVTKNNKLKTIPKKGTIFSVSLDDYMFSIFGSNFMFKASDRACKSFKVKPLIDLL